MMHLCHTMHVLDAPARIHELSHIFVQFTFSGLIDMAFASPYFDHDAFMYHALHVLDTPACNNIWCCQ